jgi:hypothetical protein
MTTGNYVVPLTPASIVSANPLVITVTGLKTFTFTSGSGTLASTACTFSTAVIRSGYNVNSVAVANTGSYVVNFSVPFFNGNYCYTFGINDYRRTVGSSTSAAAARVASLEVRSADTTGTLTDVAVVNVACFA